MPRVDALDRLPAWADPALRLDLPTGVELIARFRPAWMSRAACRGYPVDLFHPGRGNGCERALAICRRCPVMAECRAWADELEGNGPIVGVYGGTSSMQRRAARAGRGKGLATG
jgi:WhiB family redox-sensing transcriptional regulator